VDNKYTLHISIVLVICVKSYQIWCKFNEVLTKTSCVIFWSTLYLFYDPDRRWVLSENGNKCCAQTWVKFRLPSVTGVRLFAVITLQTLQWEMGDKI